MTTRRRRIPALALVATGLIACVTPVLATGEASAASVATWDKVADCESSGNWAINTGNGYYGGLQFSRSTWLSYGGGQYAAYPHQATKQQQILIGEKVLAGQGQGAWPTCGPKAGLGSDHTDPYPSTTPPPAAAPAPSLGDTGSVVAEDGTQYTFTRDAANGHLQVTYLPKGGNWATADLTNQVGTPASAGGAPATFIQQNGTIGVTTADAANGHLRITYLPKGGNWATVDLNGQIGTPVTGGGVSNTVAPDGTLYIFSRGSADGGHLSATYLNSAGTWATADMTATVGTPVSAGGAPSAFVQKDGTVGVVTANAANGHVFMTYLPNGGQWMGDDMTTLAGTPVSDGNISNVNAADGTHYIFSRGSMNGGHLSATYAAPGWATVDMTSYVGTPASAGGAPSAFLQKDGTVGVVTANAANGHVYMTYLPSGGQWTGADMTTLAGTPVTGGSISNAIAPDGMHYIFTVGSTNGGHLSATYAGTSWATTDMTSYVGTPAAG
ncbi:transglycosylase family protein [Kitasatospora sp. KL5]|uniref:transglycosylase family protein n=1 Tax=Kitasatospora sp. KL5 TaxID=3425125 RepID=UPI003D6E8B5E